MWQHPSDRRIESTGFKYWLDLARTAEESNLDFLFFGDVLGATDSSPGALAASIESAKELPAHDPFSIAPAILAATRHLGVVITASTTYEHPFSLARRFSTLDHLSNGRVGWNVVTSYLPNAAANFGLDGMLDHDLRYDRADEFLEVAFKLWEGSWADDAYVGDRDSGVFAHGDRVRTIDHVGEIFRVKGPHLSHPSLQRSPVIFQAGWSPRGKRFAAENSEVLFAGSQPADAMRKGIDDVRRQADAVGRDGSSMQFLSAFSVVTAPTKTLVQDKFDELQRFHARGFASRLAEYAGWSGIDLSKYADHETIGPSDSNRVQHDAPGPAPTAGQIRESLRTLGADSPNVFMGTPDDVADQIEEFAAGSGVDGLVLRSFVSPGSLEDFAEHIVPRLIERGLYREGPPQGALRARFSRDSAPRIDASHPAAAYRW
ncbi:NtaA/DmoA family FMN-dependent monooxygenase [Microbacterium saperdae]